MTQKISFTKMHGCGNDYIYINTIEFAVPHPSEAARIWSDRHKGIGSDGLVLIGASAVPEADFTMHIYNADGSEAMMCGNASRCIGKYLYERGLTDKTEIRLLTLSGVKTLLLHIINNKVESVTVDMGKPVLEDESQFITSRGLNYGTFVSMGNPHCAVYTKNVKDLDLEKYGSFIEHADIFPQKANIEFVEVIDRNNLFLRTWERNCGETLACGTGCCATAVACILNGLTDDEVTVHVLGGDIICRWDKEDGNVYMTGPAVTVFEGSIEI